MEELIKESEERQDESHLAMLDSEFNEKADLLEATLDDKLHVELSEMLNQRVDAAVAAAVPAAQGPRNLEAEQVPICCRS